MADFNWSPYAVGGATRNDAFSGMNAQFRGALQGLISSAPAGIREQLQVYSGYRSPQVQSGLYSRALQKYGSPQAARQWVAPPNKSQHGKGMAADLKYLSPQAKAWVRENAPVHGLSFPLKNEPWHVELATARNPNARTPPADIPNVPQAGLAYAATPTPRPTSNPFDAILSPASAQASSFPATPAPVQREALPDAMPTLTDTGRFGPSAKTGRLPAAAPGLFDDGRFLAGTVPTTPQQLQRGLLDQQLNAGILPGLMEPPTSWPGQAAPAATPGYVDPMVTTQQPSIQTAAVQAPETTGSVSHGGLLSPAEAAQVQQQQGLLGGQLQHSTPAEFQAYADRTRQAMQRQNMVGALGGGLLGGLVLGPVGAIAGGLLGKTVASRNFFPEAPQANPNQQQQKSGYAGLNESGRRSYSESKQFRDAVDGKMSAGLW